MELQKPRPDPPKVEIVTHGGMPNTPLDDGSSLDHAAESFTQLYSPLVCALCLEGVANIEEHLQNAHSAEELTDYQPPDDPKKWSPKVSEKEAAAHPGGREGALIEKTILMSEREGYRQDILALIRAGHQPGFLVSQIAWHMLVIRRFRLRFDRAHLEDAA